MTELKEMLKERRKIRKRRGVMPFVISMILIGLVFVYGLFFGKSELNEANWTCQKEPRIVKELGQCTIQNKYSGICTVLLDNNEVAYLSKPAVIGQKVIKCKMEGTTKWKTIASSGDL